MKISSLQENLKNGLNTVSHIAGKNVNLPILNNVLIEARENNIKLSTTDLEIGIVTLIRGKVEGEGSLTVEAKILSDYVSLLPNRKIDMEVSKENLKVVCENYKTSIKGQAAEEFPLIPSVNKDDVYQVDMEEFKKALSQLIFAVSLSGSRIELTGIYFFISAKNITMAATDSFRLAEKTVAAKTASGKERGIIIPAKTLQELIRIISSSKSENINEEKTLKFYLSDNQILFEIANTQLISRLIEGQYPDYRQIIPNNQKTSAVVNRAEFIRAVKAASLFSKSGVNDINLDFPMGKNMIVVTSQSGQTGENTTNLDCALEGSENGIVVNYRYLLDGLNNINEENVKLKIIDGNTPCILEPIEQKDYKYIIMPIKQ